MADKKIHGTENPVKGERHWNIKLLDVDIKEIRKRYRDGGITQRALAEMFSVTQQHISDIVTFKDRHVI